jgi:hypothetical protein
MSTFAAYIYNIYTDKKMKTAIKYILAYFAILNFVAPMCVAAVYALYGYAAHGVFSFQLLNTGTLLTAQIVGMLLMAIYLYSQGEVGIGRRTVKPMTMAASLTAWASCYWIVSMASRWMTWLPNIMEENFNNMLSGWDGVVAIVLIGPVVEELLFRRAVVDSLLRSNYSPAKAIVVSALIFGLFHINPAQIVPAFLLGLLFAYIYYTTKSLLPTIILHIVSNGLSVCLMRLPDPIEDITELVSTGPAIGITIASAILLFFSTRCIERLK